MIEEYIEELQEAVKKALLLFFISSFLTVLLLVLASTWKYFWLFSLVFFAFSIYVISYAQTLNDVIRDLKTRLGDENEDR